MELNTKLILEVNELLKTAKCNLHCGEDNINDDCQNCTLTFEGFCLKGVVEKICTEGTMSETSARIGNMLNIHARHG